MSNQSIDKEIVTAGDMSADITSAGTHIELHRAYAVQLVWTGAPVGDMKLQGSNDGTNWPDIPGALKAAGGAGDDAVINVTGAGYKQVRVKYVSTSGTGVLTATLFAKAG